MDIVLLGLIIGMANALLAVGLVLIHMSNRVINLAHGELGAFAVAVMLGLTRVADWNYWLALPASLAATCVLAAIIERSIIRRLARSPRLIVLIATIGVAQIIIVSRLLVPKPTLGGQKILAGGANIFPVPFATPVVEFGRIVLRPQHFMVLVAGPMLALGLAAFLRWSSYGIALRAASENAQRARLLGIPVQLVSTMAWVAAALLSGAAAILLAPIIGFSATEAVGMPILMRGLAAATVARMESVPIAFAAGLGLGVVDQTVFFMTGKSGLTEIVLFSIMLVAILARRRGAKRTVAAEESSWESVEPVRPLPSEITADVRWRLLVAGCVAVALAVAGILPFVLGPSATFFVATVFFVAVIAVSMTVLTGWAGQLSLGQWALAGVAGVYGAKLMGDYGHPFWRAALLATLVGGAVTLLMGLPALRLEGTALAVVTLGFAVVASSWLFERPWFKDTTGFLLRPEALTIRWYYASGLAFLVLAVIGARGLQRTRIGRNMIAVRDNPSQAQSYGVPSARTKLTAFMLSGLLASAAGFMWTAGVGLARGAAFPPVRSLTLVAAVVIGGLGSIAGAVIGAFFIQGIPYFGAAISPLIGLLATGFGLLLLILMMPGGLVRPVFAVRDIAARLVTGLDPRPKVLPPPGDELEAVKAAL